jgi:hypothetical protein
MIWDLTTADGTVDVVIPVQLDMQNSQLAPDTPGRDKFVAEGTVIPAAEPILSQPAAQDSRLIDTPIKQDSSTLLPFTTLA